MVLLIIIPIKWLFHWGIPYFQTNPYIAFLCFSLKQFHWTMTEASLKHHWSIQVSEPKSMGHWTFHVPCILFQSVSVFQHDSLQGTYLFRPSRLPTPFQSAERFLPQASRLWLWTVWCTSAWICFFCGAHIVTRDVRCLWKVGIKSGSPF